MAKYSTNSLGIAAAATTALFWGFLAITLKVATNEIDPYTIVWFRFAMAFLVLLIFTAIKDRSQFYIFKKPPFTLLIAALGLGINYISFLKGLEYTGPATAQVIIQIGPILLGLVGVVLFKEKIAPLQILGFLIAGVGLYFFYNEQLKLFVNNPETLNKGVFWVLLAAFSWLIYAIFQKKLVVKHSTSTLNLIIYGLPAVLFIPFTDFSVFQTLSLTYWLLMIFLGINTIVAYGCLALAFKFTEAYKVSIIITLNPLITIITLSILNYISVSWIAPERFTLIMIIGAILELSGAAIAVYFSRKKNSK